MKEVIIPSAPGKPFTWIDITQPDEKELLQVAEEFKLHPYTVRDSMERGHLPKIETVENVTFIITRLYNLKAGKTDSVQDMTSKVAIFYGNDFVITIHRIGWPFPEEVKQLFQSKKDVTPLKVVTRILWQVINTYEKPSDDLLDEVDDYESRIFLKDHISNLQQNLYYLKRPAEMGRRMLVLTTDVINQVRLKEKNNPFLQDVQDLHVKLLTKYDQVISSLNNLLNVYISLSAQRTNEVMKVIAIFSVFFMPLTFIVGVYGMNFQHMPELSEAWAYPLVWVTMIFISFIIYLWFRRKKWL